MVLLVLRVMTIYDKEVVENGRKMYSHGVPYLFAYTETGIIKWESFVKYNLIDSDFEDATLLQPPSLIIGPTPISGCKFFTEHPTSRVLFSTDHDGPVTQACVKDSFNERKLWNPALRGVIIYERRMYDDNQMQLLIMNTNY